jgi:single-strand DNA-binding protein
MNRVMLSGRVSAPPERSFRPDGSQVIQFSLELHDSEDRSSRQGRNIIEIVAFNRVAECELDGIQTGQDLLVEGRLRQRRWQTPEGKTRSRIEVIATDLRIMKGEETSERGKTKKTE